MDRLIQKYKYILKETAWYSLANVLVQLCSLVGVLFVSRYLGPTNLGLYSFAQNFIAGFVTILAAFDIYANWHIVKSENVYREIIVYTIQKVIIAIPVITILLTSAYFVLPKDVFRLTFVLCVPVITSIFSSFIFVTQYNKKAKLVALAMSGSALLLLVCKIVSVYSKAPLVVFVAINSIDGILLTLAAVYYILGSLKDSVVSMEDFKLAFYKIPTLLYNSIYPLIYTVFWFVVLRVDQFVVPLYFNAYSLGIYSSAVKVIEMTNVIIIILQAVILPRIMHISDPIKSRKNMYATLAVYIVFAVITSLSISILAPFVVSILFGEAYKETAQILSIYAWSVPGLFVSYLFALVLISQRNFRILALHAIVTALFMTLSVIYAAKNQSLYLIAMSSVCIYTLSACGYYILWRNKVY